MVVSVQREACIARVRRLGDSGTRQHDDVAILGDRWNRRTRRDADAGTGVERGLNVGALQVSPGRSGDEVRRPADAGRGAIRDRDVDRVDEPQSRAPACRDADAIHIEEWTRSLDDTAVPTVRSAIGTDRAVDARRAIDLDRVIVDRWTA